MGIEGIEGLVGLGGVGEDPEDGETDDGVEDVIVEDADETADDPPEMPDPLDGQLIDTVDTTGDGYANVRLIDTDDDGKVDFVQGDMDNDGYTDVQLLDTDADGTPDAGYGIENMENLSGGIEDFDWIERDNPDLDSDHDGISNVDEHELGTDTLNQDTDGDYFSDKEELEQGSDPQDWLSSQDAEIVGFEAAQDAEYAAEMDSGMDTDVGGFDAGVDTVDTDMSSMDTSSYDTTSYDTDYSSDV